MKGSLECRGACEQTENGHLDTTTVRKPSECKRKPPPVQEHALKGVPRRCRDRSTSGREGRQAAWETCGVSSTRASQSAQRPGLEEVRLEERDLHRQIVQDVRT